MRNRGASSPPRAGRRRRASRHRRRRAWNPRPRRRRCPSPWRTGHARSASTRSARAWPRAGWRRSGARRSRALRDSRSASSSRRCTRTCRAGPSWSQMFISEAAFAAQLAHPNIVHVFDFGQLEGRYFIAMEYVPGVTLRVAHKRMVARGERLPVTTVLHVMMDVCDALEHVHERGRRARAAGPRAPGHQPRQHHHLDQRQREADRLRRGARHRAHAADAGVRRQVPLRGARAHPPRQRGPPQRRLLGRRDPVRVPRRQAPLRRNRHGGHQGRAREPWLRSARARADGAGRASPRW